MERSNKSIIILLILILVIIGIGGYCIYKLNDKIDQQNNVIVDLKNENSRNKAIIENIAENNSNTNNQLSNTEGTSQTNFTTTNTANENQISSNKLSTEDTIKELFLAKLKEINNSNSEKLLDYRVDKVEILNDSEKQSFLQIGYNLTDTLAYVTYSVKPKNVNTSNWIAGNGEINGEWITNKTACECLRNGKLVDSTGFNTSW